MANRGTHTNRSQFYISLRARPDLDGFNCVFGQVVRGWDVLKAVESVGSSLLNPLGFTYHEVRIADCGVEQQVQDDDLDPNQEHELEIVIPSHAQYE
jgi:cyclophilin family peptidyl-prolyl cis-trans isomerase